MRDSRDASIPGGRLITDCSYCSGDCIHESNLRELSRLGQEMEFQKADAGKPDLAILPYTALCAWAEGLSYGEKIKGYTRNNWRLATPADEVRLRAAALRHLHQYNEARECGEEGLDEESGLSHLSLAMCNLGFLIELRERSKKK